MPKAKVIRTGVSNDRQFVLLQKEQDGFHVSGFAHPVEEMEAGQEIELPAAIDKQIDWQA